MSESRIHLLGNGIPERQKAKLAAQNVTVGEVEQAILAVREENRAMVEFYMRQVPDLFLRMIADFATAQGWEIKPPAAMVSLGVSENTTGSLDAL